MAEQFIRIGTGGQGSTGSSDAEQDWINRSTDEGVVFAHDFRTQAEVTNFLFPTTEGTFPELNLWMNGGGVTGGAYRAVVPAGGTHHGGWERPFSPMLAGGNGLAVNDAALNGTLTRRVWTPGSSTLGNWADGYYQHPIYQVAATHPQPERAATIAGGASGFRCDNLPGRDFYISFRVRMPAARFNGNQPDGKLVMILLTGDGPLVGTHQPRTPNSELVIKSNPSALYQMYTNFGRRSNSFLTSVQGNSGEGAYQPGGEYAANCVIGNTTTNTCWFFPPDEWVNVMVHMSPGREGGNGDDPIVAGNPNNDTAVEIWVQRAGEWEWRKIWEKLNYVWSYGQGDPWPNGFNSFAFNAYMNDVNAVQAYYHEYTQVIFSRRWIRPALPIGASAPAHFKNSTPLQVYSVAGGTGQKITDVVPSVGNRPVDFDISKATEAWTGASIDPEEGELLLVAKAGHTDGSQNDAYGCRIRAATPAWRRLADPTIAVDPNDIEFSVAGSAYNSNGKMRANHGWNRDCFLAGRHWVEPEGTYQNGRRQTAQWSWNKRAIAGQSLPVSAANSPYTNHGDCLPTKGGNLETQGGPSAPDRHGFKVWNAANQGANDLDQSFWTIHAATFLKEQYPLRLGAAGNGFPTWMGIAEELRLLIVGCEQGFINIINLATPTALTQATPSGTGAYISGVGCVYHWKSRAFLCWDGYSNFVRKLTVPANPFGASGWAWSQVNLTGLALPTTHDGLNRGSYSKFNIVENMGNGQSALVCYQHTNEPVYVIPLPLTGV